MGDPRRSPIRDCVRAWKVSLRQQPEVAVNVDLEEDFEDERRRLLALVDWRRHLCGGSEVAIKTDLVVVATRELIRAYETLKGYGRRRPRHRGQI
jgi:hypothetical protein